MRVLVLASLFLFGFSQAAQAGLLSDDEARRKIADLQQQVQSQNQANQASLDALKKRVESMEAIVKGQGLSDMLSEIERLNAELTRVKGQLEVATHNIELTQQRQKDLYGDTDGRLRKLEGAGLQQSAAGDAAAVSSANPAATDAAPAGTVNANAEARDFEAAQSLMKAGKYKEAFEANEKFIQTYPNSVYLPEAHYALGYSQFSLKNYKAAMTTQQKMIKQYPDHPKVPDAMYSIANCQIQLSDVVGAKSTLRNLLNQYPNSEVAPSARKRLKVLESIKSR